MEIPGAATGEDGLSDPLPVLAWEFPIQKLHQRRSGNVVGVPKQAIPPASHPLSVIQHGK
jgi:hypothetical protein